VRWQTEDLRWTYRLFQHQGRLHTGCTMDTAAAKAADMASMEKPRRRGLAVRAANPIPKQLVDTIRDAGDIAGSAEGMRAMARAIDLKGGVDTILRQAQSQRASSSESTECDTATSASVARPASSDDCADAASGDAAAAAGPRRRIEPRAPGPAKGAARRSKVGRLSAKKRRSKARAQAASGRAPDEDLTATETEIGVAEAANANVSATDAATSAAASGLNPDYLEAALAIAAQQSGMSRRQVRKRLQKSAANGHLARVAPQLLASIPPEMRDIAIERLSQRS